MSETVLLRRTSPARTTRGLRRLAGGLALGLVLAACASEAGEAEGDEELDGDVDTSEQAAAMTWESRRCTEIANSAKRYVFYHTRRADAAWLEGTSGGHWTIFGFHDGCMKWNGKEPFRYSIYNKAKDLGPKCEFVFDLSSTASRRGDKECYCMRSQRMWPKTSWPPPRPLWCVHRKTRH